MVWVTFPVPKVKGRGSRKKNRRGTRSTDAPSRELLVPTDIWIIIAGFLPKDDWKSLRLVCRDLRSDMTRMPLITTLWFSSHREDLEVFHAVCNDEIFSRHITTIYYDTVRFPKLSKEQLIARWPTTNELECERVLRFHKRIEHQNIMLAKEVPTLVTGMAKLPQLSKIHFRDSLSGEVTRSPFTRKYRTVDTCDWLVAERSWRQATISLDQVKTVILAMGEHGPSIDELNFSRDRNTVPRNLFPLSEGDTFKIAKQVFSNLKSLHITFHDNGMAGQQPVGEGFLKLFHSAKNLERLYLDGGKMGLTDIESLTDELAILFSPGKPDNALQPTITFPRLQALDLLSWSTENTTLRTILRNHSESLKWMNLDMITFGGDLVAIDGWRPTLAFMTEKMSLDAVNLVIESYERRLPLPLPPWQFQAPQFQGQLALYNALMAFAGSRVPLVNASSFTEDPWWTVRNQVIDKERQNLGGNNIAPWKPNGKVGKQYLAWDRLPAPLKRSYHYRERLEQ